MPAGGPAGGKREERAGGDISWITSETICRLIKTSAARRREKLTFRNEIEAPRKDIHVEGGRGVGKESDDGGGGGKKVGRASEFNLK